ncbi:MAG: DUF4395 domain-containing protein [Chloroflexota bacterium]
MPNAVPADAAAKLPPARMIDPRGHRFGAATSSLILIASFVAGWVPGVAIVLVSIGVSAAFGLKYSIYGAIWRRLAKAAHLGKAEPEHEYPPRFAQTLGSIALIASLLAFAVGWWAVGWTLALAVAGLQGLLGITGYCLGCRLYFLRWWIPDLITSIWTRGARRQVIQAQPIRYG